MAQRKTKQRNQAVKKYFNSLDSLKYKLEYRLKLTADKFFLNENTVYQIIKALGPYKEEEK